MTQPVKEDSKLADSKDRPQIADQGAAVTAASGGATVDAEARTAINAVIERLEAHGLIADN